MPAWIRFVRKNDVLYEKSTAGSENPHRPPFPQHSSDGVKVSPQLLKAIFLLTQKHVREYESAIGPISLPQQVLEAWEIQEEKG